MTLLLGVLLAAVKTNICHNPGLTKAADQISTRQTLKYKISVRGKLRNLITLEIDDAVLGYKFDQ